MSKPCMIEKNGMIQEYGNFDVVIDEKNQTVFIKPFDESVWFIPPGSKFKYKLDHNKFTQVLTVVFKDGLMGFFPNGYLYKEEV